MKNTFKTFFLMLAVLFALTGCGTTEGYKDYLETYKTVETAKFAADKEVATSLGKYTTGESGSLAVMALAFRGMNQQTQSGGGLKAPESASETVRLWAGTLLPFGRDVVNAVAGVHTVKYQSESATTLGVAQYGTFKDISGFNKGNVITYGPQNSGNTATGPNTTTTPTPVVIAPAAPIINTPIVAAPVIITPIVTPVTPTL